MLKLERVKARCNPVALHMCGPLPNLFSLILNIYPSGRHERMDTDTVDSIFLLINPSWYLTVITMVLLARLLLVCQIKQPQQSNSPRCVRA